MNPLRIITDTISLWWYHFVTILWLSVLWLVLQFLVVTGPPATAAFYAMMQDSYDRQYWDIRDYFSAFKEMFWPAWRWAIVNIIIVGLGYFNLSYYVEGNTIWVILRAVWAATLGLWFAVNLFFWPFWLAQEDRSLRNTWSNAGRFLMLHPLTAVVLAIISALLLAISTITLLPYLLGVAGLIALAGIIAVQTSLNMYRDPGANEKGPDNGASSGP